MSLNLDIPGNLEAQLRSEASKQGLPLPDYIIQVLSSSGPSASTASGSEVVAYWEREGLLGARSDIGQPTSRPITASAGRAAGSVVTMDLLDTDMLIDVQRDYPPAIEWFAS